mmetsp:Transcript_11959/g.28953  ORF Transcript_11959/g.28953 Transcript_11959/m.28953 type:complete len:213 (+) Transcript_11959:457-1095(+)
MFFSSSAVCLSIAVSLDVCSLFATFSIASSFSNSSCFRSSSSSRSFSSSSFLFFSAASLSSSSVGKKLKIFFSAFAAAPTAPTASPPSSAAADAPPTSAGEEGDPAVPVVVPAVLELWKMHILIHLLFLIHPVRATAREHRQQLPWLPRGLGRAPPRPIRLPRFLTRARYTPARSDLKIGTPRLKDQEMIATDHEMLPMEATNTDNHGERNA